MPPERDIYFQKAVEEGYLARSAYKLLQIDEVFNIFEGVTKAIDLCSAPGSWTQVIYNKLHNVINDYKSKLNPKVKIVSVDMMPMKHFPGVVHLEADISQYSTMKTIMDEFNNEKVDIVICDGAIDVLGMKMIDYFMHHHIFLSALYIMLNVLKTGGTFIIKIFIDKGHEKMIHKLDLFFKNVCIVKPHCSRNKEAFAVCRDYLPMSGFDPLEITPYVELKNYDFSNLDDLHKILIPYLCLDCKVFWKASESEENFVLSTSEAERDVWNTLDSLLKDFEDEISLINERIAKKPLVYEITKDNRLQYDKETTKLLFEGFKQNKMVNEHLNAEQNKDMLEKESVSFSELYCSKEKDGKTVQEILNEKIKALELENRGKFSGLGFNLHDWTFFCKGISVSKAQIMGNEQIESVYKDFDKIEEKLKNPIEIYRDDNLRNLSNKREEAKHKIKAYFFEDDHVS